MNVTPKQIHEAEEASQAAEPMQLDSANVANHPTPAIDSTGLVAQLKRSLADCAASLEWMDQVMPGFLDEAGLDEEDEEWIPIARERAKAARELLCATVELSHGTQTNDNL